jgi:signal transduction histidine kinase
VSCIKAQTYAAEKRNHKFKIEPFSAIPPVRADPNTLRRVLINLIENSVKYTPDGGLITLSARDEGDFATVSIKDNGRGIPHEDLPILFDKFYRGKPNFRAADTVSATTATDLLEDANVSGIGLGLYLARNVMEKMNGRISVETEVGRGSTFTLHLPVWRDSDLNGPMSEEKENGKTVVGS